MPRWTVLEYLRERTQEYREMIRKRRLDQSIVDRALEVDRRYLALLREIEELRARHNKFSREIRGAKGEEKKRLIEEVRALVKQIEHREAEFEEVKREWEAALRRLPNILADDVPEGDSDEDNVPLRFHGRPKVYRGHLDLFREQTEKWGHRVEHEVVDRKPVPHADMLENVLRMGDTLQAARVAGSRFYYLYDDLVWLDFALSLYALEVITSRGYRPVIPPYLIRTRVLEGAIDYETFKDMIYKVEGEDLNLIGTAEHPLMGLLYENPAREEDLPIKLAGWSPCFRKEAGAGNRDLKGIFRVHQFHKVEQFVFAHPDDSWEYLEEMTRNTEDIIRGLELPYRVVNVASGELGMAAAKKYDIEIWYPAQGRYREIASISQVLDWQAFRANLTYMRKKDGRREYVHTLNGTGLPSTRVITAILENHQDEDGRVRIPKALRKYLEPIHQAPKDYIEPRGAKGRK